MSFRAALTALTALTLVAAVAPPSARAAAPRATPQRWAVVIGVGDTLAPGIPSTPNAIVDAEQVRDWLVTSGGLPSERVLLLADGGERLLRPAATQARVAPTKANIQLALERWLTSRASPGDTVIVYFAGQGRVDPRRPRRAPPRAAGRQPRRAR